MVKASKGPYNRRTRQLKGKIIVSVAKLVSTFNLGDMVRITPKAKWIGMPHLRYTNKHGKIVEKRGKSYVVEVNDYKMKKRIIANPIHLTLSA